MTRSVIGASRRREVARLRRERPRNRFVRLSLATLLLVTAVAWMFGEFYLTDLTSPRRLANLQRFLERAAPEPVREGDTSLSATLHWSWDIFRDPGFEAGVATLAVAVAAIVLAGLGALLLTLPAARNLATPEPFLPAGRPPHLSSRLIWATLVFATRLFLVFCRAIPEYIWAFLLLAMLGPNAWPAVLALALHNMGILGRLGAEAVENAERAAPAALRGVGAKRVSIAGASLFPAVFPRLLLYFFYRWETCVREATILGMLGFTSLGYFIKDAWVRDRYDRLVFLVLLGAALVLIGDLVSAVARHFLRRAA